MPDEPDFTIGKAQSAALVYKNTPKLRALIEVVGGWLPGITAASTYIVERLSQLERERAEALFTYLDEAGAVLTPELIQKDDFLHCFVITTRAAQRTRRKAKIRLFARLLASAAAGEAITDVDEYEELLGVLDDMSLREIRAVASLDRHQKTNYFRKTAWEAQKHRLLVEVGVPAEEINAFLVRLMRTGLYAEQVKAQYDGNMNEGRLTPRWNRLRTLIADADGNVITPEPVTDTIDPSTTAGAH